MISRLFIVHMYLCCHTHAQTHTHTHTHTCAHAHTYHCWFGVIYNFIINNSTWLKIRKVTVKSIPSKVKCKRYGSMLIRVHVYIQLSVPSCFIVIQLCLFVQEVLENTLAKLKQSAVVKQVAAGREFTVNVDVVILVPLSFGLHKFFFPLGHSLSE